MSVLVTGGAGYIGSHTVVELLGAGYEPVIVDNLSNSKKVAIDRIEQITGKKVKFYEEDCCDKAAMERIFEAEGDIDSVIHFAGYKAVGESVKEPLKYYTNNLVATLTLVDIMQRHNVNNLVFSSSATVYGNPKSAPFAEDLGRGKTTNPYGTTKAMIEQILEDICAADASMHVMLLRYFNPVGAHESGLIGEDPKGIPNNLMPYITQVAIGKLPKLGVFGDDYDTPDGTGVRDYIHVVDLALGHVAALSKINEKPGANIYNLGTGVGYSVLDMVKAFSKACGKDIPYEIKERRPGDIATCYSDPSKALSELNWKAERTLDDMCASSWKWQSQNPKGYE